MDGKQKGLLESLPIIGQIKDPKMRVAAAALLGFTILAAIAITLSYLTKKKETASTESEKK